MQGPILEMLKKIAQSGDSRFCMPGHKGRAGFPGGAISSLDITELPGADNLYMPSGAILESQQLYAQSIGAAYSFYIVNGSSCGVHAGVLSVLRPGDKVICARDFHLSAVNAFAFAGARPVFVHTTAARTELAGVVTPQDIRAAIREHPDAKAVYLTYPNYYGLCPDLNAICAAAHRAGMKVICDAAHAATFDFSDLLPTSPAEAGCDIWTTSLHKTLPAMNQCAALSIGENSGIHPSEVQYRLNMLQTTSPSYILLGSCDYTTAYMRDTGKEKLEAVIALVEDNIRRIEALGGFRCVTKDVPVGSGAYDRDILKLVIDVTDRGVTGFGAAKKLAAKGVCVETADMQNVVLICSVADGKEDFARLRQALDSIRGTSYNIVATMGVEEMAEIFDQQVVMDLRQAMFARRRNVALLESVGRISAVSVGAYPPGTPIIVPGQKITFEMVNYIARLRQHGFTIFGSDGSIDIVEE